MLIRLAQIASPIGKQCPANIRNPVSDSRHARLFQHNAELLVPRAHAHMQYATHEILIGEPQAHPANCVSQQYGLQFSSARLQRLSVLNTSRECAEKLLSLMPVSHRAGRKSSKGITALPQRFSA